MKKKTMKKKSYILSQRKSVNLTCSAKNLAEVLHLIFFPLRGGIST